MHLKKCITESVGRGVVSDVGTLVLALLGGVSAVVLLACALVLGARELRSDLGSDRALDKRRKHSAHTHYATDESNDTCQESEDSGSSLRRSESFHRAMSGRSPRLRRADACRLHSLQNICSAVRRHEGEALCDHLLLHLPTDLPNYSIPKPPVPFYTMPRKHHFRSKDQNSPAQDLDQLPLPPPPEEFHTFRSASEILRNEVTNPPPAPPVTDYMNVSKSGDVIISPMNTVGLPSASSAAYDRPNGKNIAVSNASTTGTFNGRF